MHQRFSQDIEVLLERLVDSALTIKDLLQNTSERGVNLVIILLTLPFLFPMPPGFTVFLGSGTFLLALQMALGMSQPWIPGSIARFSFPKQLSLILLNNLKRITNLTARMFKPRWGGVVSNQNFVRVNGICIMWMTILLMLPIPFTNPIPTVGILLLTISTLEGDGLLLCVSYVMCLLITLFFLGIFYALWQGTSWLAWLSL